MMFGQTNAPAVFQRAIDQLLRDLVGKTVLVYLDNIIIFTKGSRQQHFQEVKKVLQCIQEVDWYLKPEKCSFAKETVDYLGFIIEEGKLIMDPYKLKAIKEWAPLTSQTDTRRFLGFAGFY